MTSYDLKEIFRMLGLPLGMVAVIVALLAWAGLTIDELATVAAGLVGLQLLQALVIDVLKYVGVVDVGTSGKWSAAFNLFTLIGVAVYLKLFPTFDIHTIDNQLLEFAKVAAIVFTYVTQIIGTKRFHGAAVQLGVGVSQSQAG